MWFEILFARTSRVNKVQGRVSAVMRAVVELFFNELSHDFGRTGVFLELAGGSFVHMFLKLDIIIADESALHGMYVCKGAGGLKPCMLCQNVFNTNETRGIVDSSVAGWAVTHDCDDSSKLVLHTSGTIRAVVRRLTAARGTIKKEDFDELQVRLGWSFVPGSLLLDARLLNLADPTIHCVFDWMHVFFVQGIFNIHVGLLVKELRPHRISYGTLHEYVGIGIGPFYSRAKLQSPGARCLRNVHVTLRKPAFSRQLRVRACRSRLCWHTSSTKSAGQLRPMS